MEIGNIISGVRNSRRPVRRPGLDGPLPQGQEGRGRVRRVRRQPRRRAAGQGGARRSRRRREGRRDGGRSGRRVRPDRQPAPLTQARSRGQHAGRPIWLSEEDFLL